MYRLAALLLTVALPMSAAAQAPAEPWSPPPADPPRGEVPPAGEPTGDAESGSDLIQRGLGTLFENLLRDVQPQMEEMARGLDRTFNRVAPVFDDLGALIDDIGNYQTPERLPNGDIIIRRRPDAPPPPQADALGDLTRPDTPSETTPPPGTPAPDTPADRPVVPSAPAIEL